MKHRKHRAFIIHIHDKHSDPLPLHQMHLYQVQIILKYPSSGLLVKKMTSPDSNCQVKKSLNNNEDNLRCPQSKVLAHPFPLVKSQLTTHPKLPFESVGSLKLRKRNYSNYGFSKPLYLDNTNDWGDDRDQKKPLIRRSPTATSF